MAGRAAVLVARTSTAHDRLTLTPWYCCCTGSFTGGRHHRVPAPVDNSAQEQRLRGRLEPWVDGALRSAQNSTCSVCRCAIAAAQGGVVSAAQTNQLGADASIIRRLLGYGAWRRARRGVYRDPHFQPDKLPAAEHHARCAALLASLSAGEAVVSHTSAARLLNLPLPPHAQEHVVITRRPPAPANRLGASSEVHVARYDEADVLDVQGVQGVPVLAGARLVLDCCSVMSPDSALAIADATLRRGLTTPVTLHTELMRWRSRPGARLATRIVERADRPSSHRPAATLRGATAIPPRSALIAAPARRVAGHPGRHSRNQAPDTSDSCSSTEGGFSDAQEGGR